MDISNNLLITFKVDANSQQLSKDKIISIFRYLNQTKSYLLISDHYFIDYNNNTRQLQISMFDQTTSQLNQWEITTQTLLEGTPKQLQTALELSLQYYEPQMMKIIKNKGKSIRILKIENPMIVEEIKIIAEMKTLEELNISIVNQQLHEGVHCLLQLYNLTKLTIRHKPSTSQRFKKQFMNTLDVSRLRDLPLKQLEIDITSMRNLQKIEIINFQALMEIEGLTSLKLKGLIINDVFEEDKIKGEYLKQEKKNYPLTTLKIEECILQPSFLMFLNRFNNITHFTYHLLYQNKSHIVRIHTTNISEFPNIKLQPEDIIEVSDSDILFRYFLEHQQSNQIADLLSFKKYLSKKAQDYKQQSQDSLVNFKLPIRRSGLSAPQVLTGYVLLNPNLKSLNLSYSMLYKISIVQIVTHLKTLTELYLNQSDLTNSSAFLLTKLEDLEVLEINGNSIDPIIQLRIFRNLQKLTKYSTTTTIKGYDDQVYCRNFKLSPKIQNKTYKYPLFYKTRKHLEVEKRSRKMN